MSELICKKCPYWKRYYNGAGDVKRLCTKKELFQNCSDGVIVRCSGYAEYVEKREKINDEIEKLERGYGK